MLRMEMKSSKRFESRIFGWPSCFPLFERCLKRFKTSPNTPLREL